MDSSSQQPAASTNQPVTPPQQSPTSSTPSTGSASNPSSGGAGSGQSAASAGSATSSTTASSASVGGSAVPPGSSPAIHPHKSHLPLIVAGLLVAVIVMGIGVYLFMSAGKQPQAVKTDVVNETVTMPTTAPTLEPTTTSDTQLEEDTKQIDKNMNSLSTEAASIDQGLNDRSENLAQ